MHYYKRNLGDYAKKCGRLSMLQHGAYTLLIDACYDREKFPTLDEALEWTWASTEAEVEAVKFVLSRFFKLGNDGQYVQDRILQELLEYHAKADKNKQIALQREANRKLKATNRAQLVHETPPNHKPLTNNQEPNKDNTSSHKRDALFLLFWQAYPKKVGKDAARKAFDKRKPSDDLVQAMIQAIKLQSQTEQWAKGYIPNPSTWLNEGRWQDECGPAIEVSNSIFAGGI